MDPRVTFRVQQLQQQLAANGGAELPPSPLAASLCKASDSGKVCSAEEAVALIPDGVWLTVRARQGCCLGRVHLGCTAPAHNALKKQSPYCACRSPRALWALPAQSCF